MNYIFTPESYLILFKSNLHQEHNLFDQEDNPNKVALGGVYESISEDEDFIYTEKNGKIWKKNLIPYEPGKYSYKIGEDVFFTPICDELDIKTLTWNHNLIIGNKYKICRIINYYFVELINEHGERTNPIRFCDITPVKE